MNPQKPAHGHGVKTTQAFWADFLLHILRVHFNFFLWKY